MATNRKPAKITSTAAVKLEGLGKVNIYAVPGQGLRLGPQSRKVLAPKEVADPMTKGERRRLRKALTRQGFAGLSKATL